MRKRSIQTEERTFVLVCVVLTAERFNSDRTKHSRFFIESRTETSSGGLGVALEGGGPELTEDPGEAEVTEFDDLLLGDEDVLRLHVSVDALQRHGQTLRGRQQSEAGS